MKWRLGFLQFPSTFSQMHLFASSHSVSRRLTGPRSSAMSDSSDDEAPEEVSLGAVRAFTVRVCLFVRVATPTVSRRAAAAAGVAPFADSRHRACHWPTHPTRVTHHQCPL